MSGHATVGNNSLGESFVDFSLVGNLDSPSVVFINMDIDFAEDNNKIRLPITEVLLCADASDLVRLTKQRDWAPCNAAPLPPFLAKAAILNEELDAFDLLRIFARSMTEWSKEGENTSGDNNNGDNDIKGGVEAEDKKKTKKGKANQDNAKTLATITDNCDNVLALLQAVAVKSPRLTAAPLSLRAYKRAHVWFGCWTDINLPTPPNLAPQDHMGLTGVLTNVATRLHAVGALCPTVAAHSKAERETKGWDRLPPTA